MATDQPISQKRELQRDSYVPTKPVQRICKKHKNYHNSIHNPWYPPKRSVHTNEKKVMFTIIGNVVTREFNESVAIVKRLTQYEPYKYGIAAIERLNALEWIEKLKHLKVKYGVLAHCSDMQVAILTNDDLLGDLNDLKKLIGGTIIFHLSLNYYKTGVAQFAKLVEKSGRSHTYMHIAKNNEYIGTLIFMLYTDLVPLTCENFLRLSTLSRGGYAGTPVHRIVKDGWIQCGGFNLQNTDLPCENYFVHHHRRGVLSMANNGWHCDNSTQFFIITEPAEWMDKKYVAFGQLVDGENTLRKIENSPTKYESPIDKITIMASGVLNLYNQGIVPVNGLVNYLNLHIQNPKWIIDDLIKDFQDQLDNMIDLNTFYDQSGESEGSSEQTYTKESLLTDKERSSKASDLTSDRGSQRTSAPKLDPINDSTILSKESQISVVFDPIDAKFYYYSLMDVPDPLERSSEFDIVKFNLGHLCLESDLEPIKPMMKPTKFKKKILLSKPKLYCEEDVSMDSEDEDDLNEFVREQADRISFCGDRIASVAKEKKRVTIQVQIPAYSENDSDGLPEEDEDQISSDAAISKPFRTNIDDVHPTTYLDEDDSESDSDRPSEKRVYITDSLKKPPIKIKRRQTGFVRIHPETHEDFTFKDLILAQRPMMVDYKPLMYVPSKNNYFLKRPSKRQPNDEENFMQLESFPERILEPEKYATCDYTNIPYNWQMHNSRRISFRSVEYNCARPSITIQEYKRRNKMSLHVSSDLKFVEQDFERKFSDTTIETTQSAYDSSDNGVRLYRPETHLKGDTPRLISRESNNSMRIDSSMDSDDKKDRD